MRTIEAKAKADGQGREEQGQERVVFLRAPAQMIADVDRIAKSRGLSRAEIVRRLCARLIEYERVA